MLLTKYKEINEKSKKEEIANNVFLLDDTYILKRYKNFSNAYKEAYIVNELKDLEVNVPKLILTKENEHIYKDEVYYYALYKMIHGEIISSTEALVSKVIQKKIGRNIAILHSSMDLVAVDGLLSEKILTKANLARSMKELLQDKIIISSGVTEEWINGLVKRVECLDIEKKLIHRDTHLGNMINCKDSIGFIDFAISNINYRIFDICYLSTSLLSDTSPFNIEVFISFVLTVIEGYQEIIKLSNEELNAIPYVIYSIQLTATAYFLKNDYKKLASSNQVSLMDLIDNEESLIKAFSL